MSVASLNRETAFQARSLVSNRIWICVHRIGRARLYWQHQTNVLCFQFRSLLRYSGQFSNYNFREYARRKTRDSFRENQNATEERRVQELMQEGLQSLRLMKVSGT